MPKVLALQMAQCTLDNRCSTSSSAMRGIGPPFDGRAEYTQPEETSSTMRPVIVGMP